MFESAASVLLFAGKISDLPLFLRTSVIGIMCWITAAWLINDALNGMLEEINAERPSDTKLSRGKHIDPVILRLHRAASPASSLQLKYWIGASMGFLGFIIGAVGLYAAR